MSPEEMAHNLWVHQRRDAEHLVSLLRMANAELLFVAGKPVIILDGGNVIDPDGWMLR